MDGTLQPAKKRIPIIDIGKGVGILLIVLGHHSLFNLYFFSYGEILGAFRIPFFFFISGATFYIGSQALRQVALKRADAWLKPWALMVVLVGCAEIFMYRGTLEKMFLGLFYATSGTLEWGGTWFLPHLWLVYMTASVLVTYGYFLIDAPFKRKLFLLLLLIFGYFVLQSFDSVGENASCREKVAFDGSLLDCGLPYSADLVFITSFFFLAGHFGSKLVKNFRMNPYLMAVSATMLVVSYARFRYGLNLTFREYDHMLILPVQAFCGIYVMLCLCDLLSKSETATQFFTYISKASLFILIFHLPLMELIKLLRPPLPYDIPMRFTQACIEYAVPVVLSIGIWEICQRSSILSALFLPLKFSKNPPARLS